MKGRARLAGAAVLFNDVAFDSGGAAGFGFDVDDDGVQLGVILGRLEADG